MGEAVIHRHSANHTAAIHDEFGIVGEGVLDRIAVEVLVDVLVAIVTAADGVRLDRPGILHPAAVINVMDVEVGKATPAGPEEAMEATNLPEQFAGFAGPALGERGS